MPSEPRFTACRSAITHSVMLLMVSLSGCKMASQSELIRTPAVATRFTANPLRDICGNGTLLVATAPHHKVGLVMQSAQAPSHVQFAGRLGTTLIRELQLSPGSCSVQPLAALHPRAEIPALPDHGESGIITISFQEDGTPTIPDQGYYPLQLPPEAPVVDQILMVRVVEYRPYFPMLATLEIKILNQGCDEPVFATTASWAASDYGLLDPQPSGSWLQKWFCPPQSFKPSPGHNSPEALMGEIAADISAWYNGVLTPAQVSRSRWSFPMRHSP